MLLKQHAEIIINSTPEAIWAFTCDPEHWTASNPLEHRGLEFFNEQNRPETGVEFYQKEYVAGFYADLRGQILWAERPRVCVWTGVASYRILGGLIRPRIPEGGVARIEQTANGCRVVHDVFMDFPSTLLGRLMLWVFRKGGGGEQAAYDHIYRELVYFKTQLEQDRTGSAAMQKY